MPIGTAFSLYRGTKASLGALSSTGMAGVLVWTTDTQELYVDSGAGIGIGPGNAWLRVTSNIAVSTVANQAARLALTGQFLGDMCVQSDTGVTYVLTALPASINGNWTPLASAPPITGAANLVLATPNGSSGAVSLRSLVVADIPPLDVGTF